MSTARDFERYIQRIEQTINSMVSDFGASKTLEVIMDSLSVFDPQEISEYLHLDIASDLDTQGLESGEDEDWVEEEDDEEDY